MKKLDNVSTRELLKTLKRRGQEQDAHLAADAVHLLKCLDSSVLDYPFAEVGKR